MFVIVTNKSNKDKTIKYCKQLYRLSTEEVTRHLIVLKYTKVNYIFMLIDTSLYRARGVDFELRYRIFLHKLFRRFNVTDREYYEGICPYTHKHCDSWYCDDCYDVDWEEESDTEE